MSSTMLNVLCVLLNLHSSPIKWVLFFPILQISKLRGYMTCSGLYSQSVTGWSSNGGLLSASPVATIPAGRWCWEVGCRTHLDSCCRSPQNPSSEGFCALNSFSGHRRKCIYVPKESLDPREGGPTHSHSQVSLKYRVWAGVGCEAGLQGVRALGY